MSIPHPTSQFSRRGAFTLIELLVVITIIAVLAGLLLPVGQKVLENSKKVSTKSTETQIVSAVNSYQAEYGQFPVVFAAGVTPTDVTYGLDATHSNHLLFDVLRATNAADPNTGVLLNGKRIVYFESKNVKNIASARDGFIPTGATATGNPQVAKPVALMQGDLVDPWGNMYIVRIDSAYTNAVFNPYAEGMPAYDKSDDPADAASPTSTDVIRLGVISWTWGYDGIVASKGTTPAAPYATVGDDVDSWQ